MEVTTANETETAQAAARLAGTLRPGAVLLLSGPLGAGKSVFARALIRALAGDETLAVPSPTFTLLQTYDTPSGIVWHFDLYRLKTPEEIYELGWDDALAGDGIVIVEWPERLGELEPPDTLTLNFLMDENNPALRRIVTRGSTS